MSTQHQLTSPRPWPSSLVLVALLATPIALGGCRAVKGIFNVGVGFGAVAVIILVALFGGVLTLARR